MYKNIDVTIIGGGFFGLYVAKYFSSLNKKVLIIEKESTAMQRASYINQARVHNGYHYPRSILTALRSRISFPQFIDEFNACIDRDFDKYYMISNRLGNITPNQFKAFCDRIGASHAPSSSTIHQLVNPGIIHGIFKVKEFVFDSILLKEMMLDRLKNNNVEFLFNHEVSRIKKVNATLELTMTSGEDTHQITSKQVFNCTYSLLNAVLSESALDLIPLKHEMTEICIVDMPEELKKIGITVMCGPFFSIIPFPPKQAHSFTHVRYTPHYNWNDNPKTPYVNADKVIQENQRKSAFKKMRLDAQRYIPMLENIQYKSSLWEVKTILPHSEIDDSRPILFKENYGIDGFHCIMGGKIDNIYDVIQTINALGLDK